MFKNRKEVKKDDFQAPRPSFHESNHAAPSMPTSSGGSKTVIGQHISIEGSIRGEEDLLIEGSIKGNIEAAEHQVTVGPKGQVAAEINAKDVTISGRMVGNIKALGRVRMTRDAEFKGEVKAKRISVEDGAYIKAVIELEREEPKKVAPMAKPDFKVPASTLPKKEPITLSGGPDKVK